MIKILVTRKAEDVNLQNIGLAIMSYFIWISELDPTSKQQNHYRENMLVLLVGNLKESYGEHPVFRLQTLSKMLLIQNTTSKKLSRD